MHRRIRNAAASGDPEAAREAMRLHMQTSREEVAALQQALSSARP